MTRKPKRLFLPSRDELVGFGLIINQWAKFENMVEYTIAALLRIDDFNGRLLTSGMTYASKRDLLRVMIEQQTQLKAPRGSAFYAELSDILDDAEKLNDIRTSVAHSVWIKGTRPDTIKPIRVRARGKLRIRGHDPKERDFNIKELISIGIDIGDLVYRLVQTAFKHRVFGTRFAPKTIRETILAMRLPRPMSRSECQKRL
jgi:hypothetical protein